MEKTYRIIDTGMTEDLYIDILASVLGQLSDGKWENSPRKEGYWEFASAIKLNATKQIILEISNESYRTKYNRVVYNPYLDMTDKEIKEVFAKHLKAIVKDEYPEPELWKRDNNKTVCDYLTRHKDMPVHISDAYWVYDRLKERKIR